MTTDTSTTQSHPRGWLATRWRRFALAVTFLTRLPLPVRGEVSPADLRASMGWYPLIGAALGAAGWGIALGCGRVFPPLLTAVLVVVLLEAFTGALHLDGLMDTCDGVGSGAPRERALEIMKDSRVGAMGVFGAIAVILLKVAALAALLPGHAMLPLIVGWAAARAVPLWDVVLFRYARPTGTGGVFAGDQSPWVLACGTGSLLAIAYLCGGLPGLALAGGVFLVTLLLQIPIARKLGGLTGDVYGMGVETAEALALLGGCILLKI